MDGGLEESMRRGEEMKSETRANISVVECKVVGAFLGSRLLRLTCVP